MEQETKDRLVKCLDKCCDRCTQIAAYMEKVFHDPLSPPVGGSNDEILAAGISALLTSQMVVMQTLVILIKDGED